MYTLTYCIIYPFLKIFHRLEVFGRENIPSKGPVIVVANHASYYDPPVAAVAFYPLPVNFMAKSELFKISIFSWVIRKLGAFPVARGYGRKALADACDILNQKKVLGIFPQGGRVKEGQDNEVFQGTAYLAAKTNAIVLPVGITGTKDIMPKGSKFPKPAKITVKIGKPLKYEGQTKTDLATFSDKIISEIYELVN